MSIDGIEKITKDFHTDPDSLKKYGKDWTTYFDINASAVVFPKNQQEVQSLVRWAITKKVGLIPSGGRTGLSGGACALNGEVVVSFDKMNRIFNFNPVEQTVQVEAGVITEAIQKFAESKGLYYPVDFAARGSSHIGGNIATNAGGIKVVRYGLTRDWIAGLKVVTGTGDLLELNNGLVKNATGYDLRHLIIGSEGTLGFVTEATIQLCAPPKNLSVMILGAQSLPQIMQVYSEFKVKTDLLAFEMFSAKALNYVIKAKGLQKPLSSDYPFYVLLEIENSENGLALECFETCLEKNLIDDGAVSQSDSQAKQFWRFREDISESISPHSPYKNDLAVTISSVPKFVEEMETVLKKNYPDWEVVVFGHIGDGNLHVNILRPTSISKEAFVKECQNVDHEIFTLVKKFRGSISAEHGVGLTKKSFLSYTRSASEIQIMKDIKKIFDPHGIINPGKLLS